MCASFQNASSVGAASGSLVTPAWTSSSVMVRRRLPIGRRFSLRCAARNIVVHAVSAPPCRDKMPCVVVQVRVNHRHLDAVHQSNGVNPYLAVVEAVVLPPNGWPVEDPLSASSKAMPRSRTLVAFLFGSQVNRRGHPYIMYLHIVKPDSIARSCSSGLHGLHHPSATLAFASAAIWLLCSPAKRTQKWPTPAFAYASKYEATPDTCPA